MFIDNGYSANSWFPILIKKVLIMLVQACCHHVFIATIPLNEIDRTSWVNHSVFVRSIITQYLILVERLQELIFMVMCPKEKINTVFEEQVIKLVIGGRERITFFNDTIKRDMSRGKNPWYLSSIGCSLYQVPLKPSDHPILDLFGLSVVTIIIKIEVHRDEMH
jgi:hypothetical protein